MTPVANVIADHIHARIVEYAGNVKVDPLGSALKMPKSLSELIRVEVIDDSGEDSMSTMGAQGAVGMALEIDIIVLAKSNKESSRAARELSASINAQLIKNFGEVNIAGVPRYRVEAVNDDQDTDGDGSVEVTVIKTQYSIMYRHRRDDAAIAA